MGVLPKMTVQVVAYSQRVHIAVDRSLAQQPDQDTLSNECVIESSTA